MNLIQYARSSEVVVMFIKDEEQNNGKVVQVGKTCVNLPKLANFGTIIYHTVLKRGSFQLLEVYPSFVLVNCSNSSISVREPLCSL